MDLFVTLVLLLALLSPILTVTLVKKSKKHKVEVDNLIASNTSLANELYDSQEKLSLIEENFAQAVREHSELEGKAALTCSQLISTPRC
ncbi:UNVERIFIED_ORG: hypothetical protein J2W64_004186 [Rahnella aquatilis]|uniref:hypothetical protein n=1 Tax=Rahnella sp. 2050 TaxID=3156425 RepID=UPI001B7C8D60|nr:hypothetical protein [Rahnella aquatilis]